MSNISEIDGFKTNYGLMKIYWKNRKYQKIPSFPAMYKYMRHMAEEVPSLLEKNSARLSCQWAGNGTDRGEQPTYYGCWNLI